MFAQVAIERVPNQLFTYAIPEQVEAKVGQCVTVPWRRVFHKGYIVAITPTPAFVAKKTTPDDPDLFGEYKAKGIREIASIDDPLPYFSERTIELLKWMSQYYSVGFTLALRSALPAPVRENGCGAREVYMVTPLVPPPPSADPKQLTKRLKFLYEELIRVDGGRLAPLCEELQTTPASIRKLAQLGFVTCEKTVLARSPLAGRRILPSKPMPLTSEQAAALDAILHSTRPILLFGVTGSGKTEVYMQAIDDSLKQGRGAIVLVPEISLTPQTVNRFAARFGNQVAVLHSSLSDGERHDEWHKIRRGEAKVVVGPRSAIFAPVQDLGLIIVDEEHDSGYKQDESPRYSARDIAVVRGKLENARVILGSATPSLESWYNATVTQKYTLVRMPHRVGNSQLPSVITLDMRGEPLPGMPIPIFSKILIEAIKTRIERGEQVVLFINRRGYAPNVQCPTCGHVMTCPHCSAKLTYHTMSDTLRCHLCGYWERPPTKCEACGASDFKFTGFGTQRVETALHTILPSARIIRMDADSTSRRHSHDQLLAAFRAKEADILLGTQMIAKGLDFPNVTLVGVLAADRSLNIAYDFRAAERTFQLLAQVSGRAGRGELPGEVIIQTFTPDHPAILAAETCAYEDFANQTLLERKETQLPPYYKLACITLVSRDEVLVKQTASRVEHDLQRVKGLLVSPAQPAPLEKKEDKYRWQILLRAETAALILAACDKYIPKDTRYTPDIQILLDIDAVFLS